MPDDFIPLNPLQVETEIQRLSNLLEQRVSDYTHAIRRAAEGKARYEFRFATIMLEVIQECENRRTTAAEREAHVTVRVADEHSAMLISDSAAKSAKEAIAALRVQIDALRTLAANHRALGGAPGH